MDANGWNGDDNTQADDISDRERDERALELEARLEQPLTEEERYFLRQADAIAAAIRKAATFSS